ncbi:hypothetical protein R3W88_031838 [Solanum pinnatisectum]|uniref:Reverse transcriptase domain-containing protein n=1 Tax=Solanum pinnatisectum TaxID=50273 RepID=A0AAV9LMG5_9SOLN|nr:hypothetical protein R3W88_031838 [Solanum pinnatisectum]
MSRIDDMMQKMMRRFDATDENVKEFRNDLSGIGQKVDVHVVSIKHLEQQMTHLSTIVNPCQPGTLPSNTIHNPKNDGHSMAVITREGKQTIDPPMPSGVEIETSKDNNVVEVTVDSENTTEKEVDFGANTWVRKILKDMVTKKWAVSFEDDDILEHCSAIATRSLVQRKEDTGSFTIPCTIGLLNFAKVLCDLSASINLMPLSIYKKLGLGDPKPTAMWLLMADRTVKRPIVMLHVVLVKVESFIFSADFVILGCEVTFKVPIILRKPFLATRRALVDMEKGQMKFRLNNEEETFNICRSMKQSSEPQLIFAITYIVESGSKV